MPGEFMKHCVAAIAKREGGTREGVSKGFAICTAAAQKRGELKPGTKELTQKGRRREKAHAGEADAAEKSAAYEKVIKRKGVKIPEESMSKLLARIEEQAGLSESIDRVPTKELPADTRGLLKKIGFRQRSVLVHPVAQAPYKFDFYANDGDNLTLFDQDARPILQSGWGGTAETTLQAGLYVELSRRDGFAVIIRVQ